MTPTTLTRMQASPGSASPRRLRPLMQLLGTTLRALGPLLAPTLSAYCRQHPRRHAESTLESERFCHFLIAAIGAGLPLNERLTQALAADSLVLAQTLDLRNG